MAVTVDEDIPCEFESDRAVPRKIEYQLGQETSAPSREWTAAVWQTPHKRLPALVNRCSTRHGSPKGACRQVRCVRKRDALKLQPKVAARVSTAPCVRKPPAAPTAHN